ncbi:MAG TPA: hypothetical protein VMR74_05690 [Gammaproteobacteria bacterium]|nr:hypothetical protein [Gammaproteobacteria bacterium]
MKFRFVTVELVRQRQRVRRAERIVQEDKAATSVAIDRFLHRVVASPAGLAACATLGFCFDRLRGDRSGRRQGGFIGRASSLATLVLWVRRMLAPTSSAADSS